MYTGINFLVLRRGRARIKINYSLDQRSTYWEFTDINVFKRHKLRVSLASSQFLIAPYVAIAQNGKSCHEVSSSFNRTFDSSLSMLPPRPLHHSPRSPLSFEQCQWDGCYWLHPLVKPTCFDNTWCIQKV